MAQRSITEFDGKKMLYSHLKMPCELAFATKETNLDLLDRENPWLLQKKLVVKPDQCFGKRGKHGLVLLNASFEEAKQFIKEKMGKAVQVGKVKGVLEAFLIEPFTPHEKEYYVAIKTFREYDEVLFSLKGGVDVEENWGAVKTIRVENAKIDSEKVKNLVQGSEKGVAEFVVRFYECFAALDFSYLEINPFTMVDGKVVPLDLVARVDDTAAFLHEEEWKDLAFPAPFGKTASKEEEYVKSLDEKTGASLKLTVLNPKGRIWTLVAGGGASVIYADTIVDLGLAGEMANYGEYSGNPSDEETYLYARTVLDLMTRDAGKGKVLLVGGGIANFTDVAKTFKGIIQALREYKERLAKSQVKIFVRRGGPNYQEGLAQMRKLGQELGVPTSVYGPETHMTRIVSLVVSELK